MITVDNRKLLYFYSTSTARVYTAKEFETVAIRDFRFKVYNLGDILSVLEQKNIYEYESLIEELKETCIDLKKYTTLVSILETV